MCGYAELMRLPIPQRRLLESDISPLTLKFAEELPGSRRVVREMGVCEHTSRIDVAAICVDRLEGFEIKSDADTHARFGSQISAWQGIFDLITLVTTRLHMERVLSGDKKYRWSRLVPEWVGLILVETEGADLVLRRVREPVMDTARLEPSSLIKCFWKAELQEMAKRRLGWKSKDLRVPKYNYRHWERLWQEIPAEDIRADLRNAYLGRQHLAQRGWKDPSE